MSRLLLLAIMVLWMCARDNVSPPAWPVAVRLGIFLGIYAALVALVSAFSRLLARRVADDSLGRTLDRYNRAIECARYFVPAWFAVGLFGLGWGHIVYDWLLPLTPSSLPRVPGASDPYWRVPGLLVGTLPAFVAWMGLWWAQYPADRALKEQSVLYRANEGLPIHAPSGFGTFFAEHLRQQLLFTLAPVFLIVSARDVLALGFLIFRPDHPLAHDGGDLMILPLALLIFVAAPELLRRVIPTTPLPAHWPLRQRMEALCRRAGLRYRDILLWQTNNSMGNAMVMGLFPQVRYIFLSDLLLETMHDEEIEAVFAHEIGHVVHRHMWWYVLFTVMLTLFTMGPLSLVLDQIPGLTIPAHVTQARANELMARQGQVVAVIGLAMFGLFFGLLSRRFERQADVYAARTMQAGRERGAVRITHVNPELESVGGGVFVVPAGLAAATLGTGTMPASTPVAASALAHSPGKSYVGEYGATIVSDALRRVARINNIPVAAHEWLHGSIQQRMRYLQELSGDATRTWRFDRYMKRLYWGLFGVLFALTAWCVVQTLYGGGAMVY